MSSLYDDAITIINSLTADEFCGKFNRFPRPGRIAGSVNVDCEILIDHSTHTYLPEAKLREGFNAVDALSSNSVITYCGGGVAASSVALALALLGVSDVAVYQKGLIEWTVDPELPMEVD